MSKLPQFRDRLRTMQGLDSILEAMMLVAAVEVQKLKAVYTHAQNYFAQVEALAQSVGLEIKKEGKKNGKSLIIVMVSNKGLCASFNAPLYREMHNFFSAEGGRQKNELELMVLGKKGLEFDTKGRRAEYAYSFTDVPSFEKTALLTNRLIERFKEEWDEVHLAYNHYHSFMFQKPTIIKVLPLSIPAKQEVPPDDFEPSLGEYQQTLARTYFKTLAHKVIVESLLGETSVRLFTLKGATDKAQEMIGDISISMNKERQGEINAELAEISSTFEILREES